MRHAFYRANFANLLAARYPLAMRELRATSDQSPQSATSRR
ncbi:hypothetical protein ACNQR7_31240 [Mycolicibacterium senegalense]